MSSLIKILTLSCEGASEFVSQAMDEPLPLTDRVALGAHLMICSSCRRFGQQLQVLRSAHAVAAAHTSMADDPSLALDAEAKERILVAIQNANDKHER